MLHLALVLPSDHARSVVEQLRAHEGVASVVHLPGAAVDPKGDVVEADVARESTDELIDRLRHLCTTRGGTITVTEVAAAIGDRVDRAERAAPGDGADAVLWDELAQQTAEQAQLSATFLVFLIAATLISAVGILTDSEVLVVGGMVLGPEFGPLASIALSIVRREPRRLLRGFVPLLIGFPIAIAATAGLVALVGATFGLPAGYLHGDRPLTSFIAHPDQFSVITALIAGVAGVVSLTSSRSGALVGVFISVTTIPAAANIGTAMISRRFDEAGGAAVQLGVNMGCLLVAAVVTLVVQRAVRRRRREREAMRRPS